MSDGFRPAGLDGVPIKAAEAAAALEALKEPAERAASSIEDAFGRAGNSLTRSLARAAADGEVTLAELARAVLGAVNVGAVAGGSGGLGAAISQAVSGLFSGARADGGDVLRRWNIVSEHRDTVEAVGVRQQPRRSWLTQCEGLRTFAQCSCGKLAVPHCLPGYCLPPSMTARCA